MPYRVTCVVPGCYNVVARNTVNKDSVAINYFSFPSLSSDEVKHKQFVKLCGLDEKQINEFTKICSEHFDSRDILGCRVGRPRLRPSAIPRRNLPWHQSENFSDHNYAISNQSDSQLYHQSENSTEPIPSANSEIRTCTDFEMVAVAVPTLHELAMSVTLPSDDWSVKITADRLSFFELAITDKPNILRSVTFCGSISTPVVHVEGALVTVEKNYKLHSASDVSSLLLSVAALSPTSCSGVGDVVKSLDKLISAKDYLINRHSDHEYSVDDNPTSCGQHDSLSTDNLKFIKHQLQLLSSPSHTTRRYETALLRWCLLIHFHSPAAYRAMLESKVLILPSERLLRSYSAPLAVAPGLCREQEDHLKEAVSNMTDLDLNAALIVDEMYIKPEISYSGGSLHGFADNCVSATAASTVLTIMVQSLCGKFREVVSFYPVKQLTGFEEADYVNQAIRVSESAGLKVCCIICDNSKVNRGMMKQFGAISENGKTITVGPKHPQDESRQLFFIVDPCHLLKCVRNNWINKGLFQIDGADVPFECIKKLFSEEQNNSVKLAPKLNLKVVSPTNMERQCVRLAATLFSSSVCAALEAYMSESPEQYPDGAATVRFLKKMHEFWCWANVQHPNQGDRNRDPHQQPFKYVTDFRLARMDEMMSWLMSWHSSSTSGLTYDTYSAFLLTLSSTKELITHLLVNEKAAFVLTGRFQQDPIEEHFGAHRQRAGCSYNPSALQFQQTESKLAVVKYVLQNFNGNTTRQEKRSAGLTWDNNPMPVKKRRDKENQLELEDDYSLDEENRQRRMDTVAESVPSFDGLMTLSSVEQQGLAYIAGYLARKLCNSVNCSDCAALLHSGRTMDDKSLHADNQTMFSYLISLSRGGLLVPTNNLVSVVAKCNHIFKYVSSDYLFIHGSNQLNILHKIITCNLQEEKKWFSAAHTAHLELFWDKLITTFCNLSLNRFGKDLSIAAANRKSRKISVYL